LQFYTQLFLARVHYGSRLTFPVPETPRGTRLTLASLIPDPKMPTIAPDPDSVQSTLNVNLVLRWEYHLGSTLFLIYTRAQNPALVPTPGGSSFELRPILEGRASSDFVMAKLAYWWG
jgi:hypothetical protein